jgi:hypothetical protein
MDMRIQKCCQFVFLTARKLSGAHCETSSAMLHKRQELLEQDLIRLSCAAALLLSIITRKYQNHNFVHSSP